MEPHFEEVQAHYDLSDDFFGTVPGSVADLQLRVLRARRHDARRGADGQDRPGAGQAEPAAGHDAARHRLRLGFGHAARRREVRRQRRRPDAEQEPGQVRARSCSTARHRAHAPRAAERAGSSSTSPSTGSSASRRSRRSRRSATSRSSRRAAASCPRDGRMVLQAILGHPLKRGRRWASRSMMTDLRFMRFIAKEIFPGGSVPVRRATSSTLSTEAGFTVERQAAARRALRAHARPVVDGAGGTPRRGRRRDVGRGLRAVHEVPGRLQRLLQAPASANWGSSRSSRADLRVTDPWGVVGSQSMFRRRTGMAIRSPQCGPGHSRGGRSAS